MSKQMFDQEKAIKEYTELMRLVRVGAYSKREPDGSYAEDGIEASLDHLDFVAARNGLKFVQGDDTVWTLQAMTDEEKPECIAAQRAKSEESARQVASEQQARQTMRSHFDSDKAYEVWKVNVRDQR